MTHRSLIMGAAGRDFHNFRTFFQVQPEFHVVAFTATQIPFIETRSFPSALAGPHYDADIPIYSETRLTELITSERIDFVFLAYSDLSHQEVMHRASIVQAAGASFVLLGPAHTELVSAKPVIALTATRTGAGKSPLTQWLAARLVADGIRAVTIRHPMPYGDLERQAVQRFAEYADFDRAECTIEEREEYEPYVRQGLVIYAGVDYAAILAAAEAEAEVILWDGGNNDFAFIRADLNLVVCDALRPGHESAFYPGETNVRRAHFAVLSKVDAAAPLQIAQLKQAISELNPEAVLIESDLAVTVDDPGMIEGRRVMVIEDGPTVTHGGMAYGAGWVAARRYGAKIMDPRPHAVGSIRETLAANPHLESVLPAMGYSREQVQELAQTIEAAAPDLVIDGSPADLGRLLKLSVPVVNVGYRFEQRSGPDLYHEVVTRVGLR